MTFEPPLIPGRLIKRYKRFLSDIELSNGEHITAHCPNPGSMKSCQPENAPVWVSKSDNPKRKLAYTWELVMAQERLTLVNTNRANGIVEEGIRGGVVEELREFASLRREVKVGDKSRIDMMLETDDGPCYVEVKNVTLDDGPKRAAFPDSVTARGTKHLHELMGLVDQGHRAVLLFCCSRADTEIIRPADEIDPTYGAALREAGAHGVELLAYACDMDTVEVRLSRRIDIELP